MSKSRAPARTAKTSKLEKIRKIYAEELKVIGKNADAYEKTIYNMCIRIAKKDGESIENVYAKVAYDKIGQFINAKTSEERKKVFEGVQNTLQDWESPVYDEPRNSFLKSIDKSVQKPKAIKGVYFCKQKGCNSDEFYMWSAQTRSNDEGMTNYRQCALCGKRRKE